MGRPRSKLDRHHGNCPCAECVRTFGPPIDYSEPAPVVPVQVMGRTEIIDRAKGIVMSHGPENALEFTTEFVTRDLGYSSDADAQADAAFEPLYQETRKQAARVIRFLGYVPVGVA